MGTSQATSTTTSRAAQKESAGADLLAWMASVDDKHISPQEFAETLRGMGVKDLTDRTNPEDRKRPS
jgi:hypothetical protein